MEEKSQEGWKKQERSHSETSGRGWCGSVILREGNVHGFITLQCTWMLFSHKFSDLLNKESPRETDGYFYSTFVYACTRDRKYRKFIIVWEDIF